MFEVCHFSTMNAGNVMMVLVTKFKMRMIVFEIYFSREFGFYKRFKHAVQSHDVARVFYLFADVLNGKGSCCFFQYQQHHYAIFRDFETAGFEECGNLQFFLGGHMGTV